MLPTPRQIHLSFIVRRTVGTLNLSSLCGRSRQIPAIPATRRTASSVLHCGTQLKPVKWLQFGIRIVVVAFMLSRLNL